jgi:hypothetical protein
VWLRKGVCLDRVQVEQVERRVVGGLLGSSLREVQWIGFVAGWQEVRTERETETETERGSPTVAQAKKHNQSFALASPRPMGSDQPVKK